MITYNDIELDIDETEVIPITKQVNEVGNLNVFKSDFTREFKVRRTKKMDALFENAWDVRSETNLPYERLDVKYIANGLEIIAKGKMSINRADDYFYYVSIYSGAVNIFNELQKQKIGDIDLSDLDHTWDAETARDSVLNDEDYQYLVFLPASIGSEGIISDGSGAIGFVIDGARPFIRVKRLIDDMLSSVVVVSDIDDDDIYENMFIPIASLELGGDIIAGALVRSLYQTTATLLTDFIPISQNIIYDPKNYISTKYYTAPVTGRYTFVFKFSVRWLFSVVPYVDDVLRADAEINVNTLAKTRVITLDVSAGGKVSFYTTYLTGFTWFVVSNIEGARLTTGANVEMDRYLPAITQADLLKSVCQFFGLIADYDAINNNLRLWNINRLIENKKIAKDWSTYLSDEVFNLEYRLEFAQENYMKWKEDDDVQIGMGDATIYVSDENLPRGKDILNFPFAYCKTGAALNEYVARIPWYDYDGTETTYTPRISITPRLVVAQEMDNDVRYYQTILPADYYAISASSARKASVQNIPMDTAVGYNYAQVLMLEQTKVTIRKFNLPAKEIMRLDHSIPIYLEQLSGYYFIKKISNWIEGEICEVELIRLK